MLSNQRKTGEHFSSTSSPVAGGYNNKQVEGSPVYVEIPSQVDELMVAIGQLETSVQDLGFSISSVSVEGKSEDTNPSRPYPLVETPMGHSLQQMVTRIDELRYRVNMMRNRVRL